MLARVLSCAVIGIDAHPVEVEVDISRGLPAFTTVGLPETAVKESRERVRSAIKNSGYRFPDDRITVNLAPAHIRKEGTGFDLPIALGILSANGTFPKQNLETLMFLGELSLDGRIKPVCGSLPMAVSARETGLTGIVVPAANGKEAAVVRGITVYPAGNLTQVVELLRNQTSLTPETADIDGLLAEEPGLSENYSEVKGQEHAKRALEIAAAGGHNILMIGPPGSGKTMLAKRLLTILPPLSFQEALETTKIFSVGGMLALNQGLVTRRTFRAPHHTISDAGLIGGGATPRPGEVSLAHNGVLFLDELPEYKKHVLEVLRQPIEDNYVTISRARTSVTYPASFMLVAAMNPCPCGYYTDTKHSCRCSDHEIHRYRSKLSGPLLDRIDMHVEVPAVPFAELHQETAAESSSVIRRRVVRARTVQDNRFKHTTIHCNAQMASRHIKNHCRIDAAANALLEQAVGKFGLSVRAIYRILKIARTIADLDNLSTISSTNLAEAVQYRTLDGFV